MCFPPNYCFVTLIVSVIQDFIYVELLGYSPNPISHSLIYWVCKVELFGEFNRLVNKGIWWFSMRKEKKESLLSLYIEASSHRSHECCSDMVRLLWVCKGHIHPIEMCNGPKMGPTVWQSLKWSWWNELALAWNRHLMWFEGPRRIWIFHYYVRIMASWKDSWKR